MDNGPNDPMCMSCAAGTCTETIKNTECALCLESIPESLRRMTVNNTKDVTININCCHGLHTACLRNWRQGLRVCPYCRTKWMSVDDVIFHNHISQYRFAIIHIMDNGPNDPMCMSCAAGTCTETIKNTECALCLESIPESLRRMTVNNTKDVTININCCHGLHTACLRNWRQGLRVCPYCRTKWMSVDDVFAIIHIMDNGPNDPMCMSCAAGTCTETIKNTECALCLESIPESLRRMTVNNTKDVTININCCHGLHTACLRNWRQGLRVCPYCRTKWMSVDDVRRE
ncbi:unnamed protein product [Mytilus coruscus]|uniref:RING-type domain-containing protein n=1 Tax=Mytilus coruscus TaxID=42192 RepID=A0A6J8EJY2_MYTCO|nr:unnamed protein product [Mytilus coruscus]